MNASQLLPLIEAAAAANLQPLQAAIEQASSELDTLTRLRDAFTAKQTLPPPIVKKHEPPSHDPPALPSPAPPAAPRVAMTREERRLQIATFLVGNGPSGLGAIGEQIGITYDGVYKAIRNDPWFERQSDGWHLTTEGLQAVKPAQD